MNKITHLKKKIDFRFQGIYIFVFFMNPQSANLMASS